MEIQLPHKAITAFKKRALRAKNEILAALIGTIVRENETITRVIVEDLVYPPARAGATLDEVSFSLEDIARMAFAVKPRVVIGTLHSHPNLEYTGLSKEDIDVAASLGETIFGVFTYWTPEGRKRRETSLDFYMGVKGVTFTLV